MTAIQRVFTGVCARTANMKLGERVMSTYRTVGVTCPSSCPFLNNGCYAQKYHTELSAKHAPTDAEVFDATMTEKVMRFVNSKRMKAPSLVRFHTSGDIMLHDEVQTDYVEMLVKWADILKNRLGIPVINYTHAWFLKGAERVKSFTRASVHHPDKARQAVDEGWHTTIAVRKHGAQEAKQELRERGLHGVQCAYQTHKIKCADCKLCEVKGNIKTVIIFEKH